jgi:hypothetical protein
LVVWPERSGLKHVYPLGQWPLEAEREAAEGRLADRQQWVFAATPITWRRWVVTWELDALGGANQHQILDDLDVLPG